MMTDPISDMLTRIRNAVTVKKHEVLVPYSRLKLNIAQILEKEQYILGVKTEEVGGHKWLNIGLRYMDNKIPAIKNLSRVSKPGRRIYVNKENLPVVLNKYGMAIISTSKGLLTSAEAKKMGIGGEVLCEIY